LKLNLLLSNLIEI